MMELVNRAERIRYRSWNSKAAPFSPKRHALLCALASEAHTIRDAGVIEC